MSLFDGRMDVYYCCLDSSSSNPWSDLVLLSLLRPWFVESMVSACYARPEQVCCAWLAWFFLFVISTTMPAWIVLEGVFVAISSSAPYWSYVGVLSSHAVRFHGQGSCRRRDDAGVILSGPPCTPAGGSYLLSPRRGSGVGVVCWASKARDSVGRRLSLSRLNRELYPLYCIHISVSDLHIKNPII